MEELVHLEVEFEAHILCVSRTHEYYKMTEYELLTLSLTLSKSKYSVLEASTALGGEMSSLFKGGPPIQAIDTSINRFPSKENPDSILAPKWIQPTMVE